METHSSILAWKNPKDRQAWWPIVYGGSQEFRHNRGTKQQQLTQSWFIKEMPEVLFKIPCLFVDMSLFKLCSKFCGSMWTCLYLW